MPIQTSPQFLKDFREREAGRSIVSPNHVQSPEIWQSHRIPGLFHITEALSVLFCPEQTSQSKQKTRHVFLSMLKKNTARQGSCQGNLCNAQMPAHETMLCFPSAPSMPAGILTPNPSLRTQVGLQDGALKTMVWPSAQKRLPARKEGRKHLRWRIIPFEM